MTDSPSMDAIAAMTPQQATEALAAMSAASNPPPPLVPQDSQDAKAHLDVLTRDTSFSQALTSGNAAARAQFDGLVAIAAAGDDIGDALAGIVEPQPLIETTMNGSLPNRDVKAAIADMRLAGISDGAIEEALRGTPVTAREYAAVTALQAAKHGDPVWVKNFLAGNYAEKREATLMAIVLSSPIAEPK